MDMQRQYAAPPCNLCTGMCCTYFALEIDKPTTIAEFENIKWYIIHENTSIFIQDGDWYLQIKNRCRHLLPDYRCGIYETRPEICRSYGFDEKGRVQCDKVTDGGYHEAEYHHPEEIDRVIRKRFPNAKNYKQPRNYPDRPGKGHAVH